jgi:hypothetical protein
MAKVKYMGSADVRRLEKGDDFGGRLADPIGVDLEWSRDNKFVVDTDEAGLSAEAVELLLSEADFKDVSDLKRIPTSLNEQIFGGLPAEPKAVSGTDGEDADAVDTAPVSGKKSGGKPVGDGGAAAGTSTTTVGGSTAGPR